MHNHQGKPPSTTNSRIRKRLCSNNDSKLAADQPINQKERKIEDNGELELELELGLEQNYCGDVFTSRNSINVLNDDCLLSVFSYLPIQDRIRIERVCKRWKRISMESWRKVKNIYIKSDFKTRSIQLNQLEQILQRSGNYMNNFDFSWLDKSSHLPANDSMKLINQYCKKVTNLNICYTFKTKRSYLNYLDKNILKNLKSLNLGNYVCHDEFLSAVLENTPNLEEFSLAGYDYKKNELLKLSDKCKTLAITYSTAFSNGMLQEVLDKYPGIQNLDISGTGIVPYTLLPFTTQIRCLALWQMANFFKVDHSNFETLKCPNLRVLDISYNDWFLTGNILSTLIDNCPAVEDLRLKRARILLSSDFKHATKLKNLMYLDVSYTRITNVDLVSLSESFGQLKKLFCYGCRYISAYGLSKIVAASPELNYLAISNSKLTKAFVQSALSSLRERKNKVSLTISLRSNLVDKIPDLVKKLELKDGTCEYSKINFLRIVFGASKCECNFDKTCFCLDDEETLVYFG